MIGGLGDVEVVVEEDIVKDLVNLLWDELAVAPLMCSVGGCILGIFMGRFPGLGVCT